MKNETTRTKTLSGFSSRAIALVLCFVMLLTAIGSGSVLSAIAADFEGNGAAVLVDAAKAGADVDAPAVGEAEESSDILAPEDIDDGYTLTKKSAADIADTGADADIAETGDTTYYLWYAKDNSVSSYSNYSSAGAMTSLGDGSYYQSYSTTASGNTAFYVNTNGSSYLSGLDETLNVSSVHSGGNVTYGTGTTGGYTQSFWTSGQSPDFQIYSIGHYASGSKTYYVTYNPTTHKVTVSTTAPSGSGSGSGSGSTSGSGLGTKVTDSDLLKVLKGDDIRFYCKTYTGSNTGLHKSGNNESDFWDCFYYLTNDSDSKYFIAQLPKTSRSTYKYITDSKKWQGNQNESITTATGGEYFDGKSAYTTAGASGSTIGTKATASTTIESSYRFYQTMSISTTPSTTTTAYGSDLVIRYYLKSGSDYYELDSIGDLAANTSGMVTSYDLSDLDLGSYTLLTVGISNINSDDRNDCMAYILDQDDFTIDDTITGAPATNEVSGKLIFNTTLSPTCIWRWESGNDGTVANLTSQGAVSSRNLYDVTAVKNPGAILFKGSHTDGSGWPGNDDKLTGDIGPATGAATGTYYVKIDSDTTGSFSDFSHISTTLTADNSTVLTGESVTVTNTPDGTLAKSTTSGLSSDQAKYVYYVVAPNGTATRANSTFTTSSTYTFTPDTVGTYKVFAYVQDMWGYETAISDNILSITVNQGYAVTVKSNNARLGTGTASPASAYAGQTVTINISENMGSISTVTATDASSNSVTVSGSGTTRTFTMPSSAVTVNLTFTDYTAASNFYYNSYETNGNESSTRYGQQMTEGRIGGQKFSYYHVEGRTGNDQLFTVSYGNPAETGTIFFRTPESWNDKHGWDSGVKAQFFSSDDVQLKDWAWMTFDKDYGNGDKVYKISVPYGARKVQFRTQKNDPSTSNWPYTAICDLKDAKNSNDCFYIKSYSSSGNQTDIGTCNIGNQARVIADGFWENFWGTNKYTDNFATKGFSDHGANHTGNHRYIKPKDLGTDSGDYYIIVLYNNTEYTINGVTHTVDKDPEIIWMPKLPGTEDIDTSEVNVYGKDGSVVIDWNNKGSSGATTTSGTAYGYGVIADTHLYDSDGTSIGTAHTHNGNDYESAKVVVSSEDSANIVIKTTINSSYTSKYYLKGWCINGVTYACGTNNEGVNTESAGTASGSDRLYTMTYTVPAGSENNSNIEITPIYYLKSSYISTNSLEMVTFYVEGYNTISSKWGDTPYIYPFYGNLNNVDNSFGVYPGQPMVYANGQYQIEIPVNKNVPIDKSLGSTAIKGITINNGYADHVHRNKVYKWSDADNDKAHKQTYDFDDFYKIYEECLKNGTEHPNAIIFRIQDEETVYNRSQYGGGKSGQFASGTSKITLSDIQDNGNGWELLVNRYGHAVNIFGDESAVDEPDSGETYATDSANALYVVSTGYNANIAGDYGTMWKIYNGSGELISNAGGRVGVPPSVLLLRGSASGYSTNISYPSANRSVDGVGSYTDSIDDYVDIYKALHASTYTGKRVYITYEKDAQDTRKETSGTGAYRLDGRWYYTHKSDSVQATMSIQYWDDATGTWKDDDGSSGTPSASGSTAVFTDSGADGHTSGSHTIQNNENYTFTASAGSGWQFDSWQFKYSDTSYDQISTSTSSSVPATVSYHIVARFVKTSAGDLTINHTLNSNSTGEGTVDMAVNVYTDSSLEEKVSGFTEKTGTRVYLDSTYINNTTNYYIKVVLKAKPMYDGKVTAFGYDSFNTSKSITATTSPDPLPGSANTLTTSTFSFPVSALYNVSTQKTKTLDYTSLITDTPHYYNFVYNFTDRGGASKSYTTKGVMDLSEYKKVVSDQADHTLDNSILVSKAPFESNFLKSNTLTKGEISYSYDSTNDKHTYSATSSFTQGDSVPNYHVVFDLPYSYYTAADSNLTPPVKKYTVQPTNGEKVYDTSTSTFDLLATYNTFVTVSATSSAVGSQSNVSKVTDGSDINHTGNNFITAPEELMDGETTMYFKYWKVSKLNSNGTAGDLVTYLYYPDFHYRVYSDYYVEAVYSSTASDSWKLNYSEENNTVIDCSVLYLGDSRNQWNDGSKSDGYTSNDATDAADLIYSDFIFHYTYKGQEIKDSTDNNLEVGMILERATYKDTSDGDKVKWLTGSTSVNDMSYYRANYGGTGDKSTETARKQAILSALNGGAGATLPSGTIKAAWDRSELNNKNFTEQSYKAYSQYGQTVANDTITFAQDSVIDNYVYRAYAYIKDTTGTYTLSDPVYFSMRYTSNLKYTE